jgi:hypothetical protein
MIARRVFLLLAALLPVAAAPGTGKPSNRPGSNALLPVTCG